MKTRRRMKLWQCKRRNRSNHAAQPQDHGALGGNLASEMTTAVTRARDGSGTYAVNSKEATRRSGRRSRRGAAVTGTATPPGGLR